MLVCIPRVCVDMVRCAGLGQDPDCVVRLPQEARVGDGGLRTGGQDRHRLSSALPRPARRLSRRGSLFLLLLDLLRVSKDQTVIYFAGFGLVSKRSLIENIHISFDQLLALNNILGKLGEPPRSHSFSGFCLGPGCNETCLQSNY